VLLADEVGAEPVDEFQRRRRDDEREQSVVLRLLGAGFPVPLVEPGLTQHGGQVLGVAVDLHEAVRLALSISRDDGEIRFEGERPALRGLERPPRCRLGLQLEDVEAASTGTLRQRRRVAGDVEGVGEEPGSGVDVAPAPGFAASGAEEAFSGGGELPYGLA